MNLLLNSGGKDSSFFNFNQKFFNVFIKINNCNNYLDLKYCLYNCLNLKKKLFFINFSKEYFKIIFFFDKLKNINIDFYCNKLLKIYLLIYFLRKKIIFSGHYIRKIKKFFIFSIDQKKDQSYFLNFNKNFFSIVGYYNKKNIKYFSFKNNFICENKKSTTGICFNYFKKKNIFFFYIENKMIFNIIKSNKYFNLGKKIFFFKIIKINQCKIILTNYFNFFKIFSLIIYKKIFIKNIYLKIKSQCIKIFAKFIIKKNINFIFFYKKQKFLDKNILIFYNDLIILNSKIKKKN